MKLILVFISLFFVFASYAQVYRHSSMFQDVQWKTSNMGYRYKDGNSYKIFFESKLYGLLNHSFSPTVDFSVEYILTTRQGATQSTFLRPKSKEQIHPSYMYLSVRPLEFEPFFIRAGLVNQEFLNAPLLISGWTFIGLQQEYVLHNETLLQYVDHLKIIFQQSIPSSDTSLEYLTKVQDLAGFYTASLFASSFVQNQVQTEGNLTVFYFRNLSPEAVNFGRTYGNDWSEEWSKPDAFLYPFYGFYARNKARYNLFPELGLELDASFLWNVGATIGAYQRRELAGNNTQEGGKEIKAKAIGYNIWLGFHIPIAKEIIMVLSLDHFNTGGNGSPAYYNSDRYVYSDRYGVILGVKSIFEKYNVFLDLEYAIVRSHQSSKESVGNPNYLSLKIGTEYDKI